MRKLLLGLAAAAIALTWPATAGAQMSGGNSGGGSSWSGGHHDGNHDGDHNRRFRNGRFVSDDARLRGRSPDGAWGYYEGDYDANRSFDSDKWNDWWHERTNRSYPRWVQEARANGSCTEDRMWWSGSGWHC